MPNKVVFCFLVYDQIVRYDIWNKFFENKNPEEYEVIIHPKLSLNPEYLNRIYKFQYREIGRDEIVNTVAKNDISIIKATLLLFKKGLEDENNSHFVFLSQSCIPLHCYNQLYKLIIGSNKSIIDCKLNVSVDRYRSLTEILQNTIPNQFFFKQQPNMILVRNDARLFVENDLTNEWGKVNCPDEHYFINNAIHIFRMNILKVQINFCNINLTRTQALTFNNVTINFIDNLKRRGFLFMRKIDRNSKIDLSYLE